MFSRFSMFSRTQGDRLLFSGRFEDVEDIENIENIIAISWGTSPRTLLRPPFSSRPHRILILVAREWQAS
jgi:hypothetical protein